MVELELKDLQEYTYQTCIDLEKEFNIACSPLAVVKDLSCTTYYLSYPDGLNEENRKYIAIGILETPINILRNNLQKALNELTLVMNGLVKLESKNV